MKLSQGQGIQYEEFTLSPPDCSDERLLRCAVPHFLTFAPFCEKILFFCSDITPPLKLFLS